MPFPQFFKVLALSPLLALTLGCTTMAQDSAEAQPLCPDPRPMVCTTIYAPVCAVHSDGREETHASSCNACADDTVVDYRQGACEDDAS